MTEWKLTADDINADLAANRDIVRTKEPTRKKRMLGTLKGKIEVLDPNWWKPMADKEVDALLEGRY